MMVTANSFHGVFYDDGKFSDVQDFLAIEESLSLSINGESFTVTMRTPGNDEELIRGLLFTEEVYRDRESDLLLSVTGKSKQGFATAIDISIPSEKILKDFAGSRNLVSASSCGLCGRTSFEDTISHQKILERSVINPESIARMFAVMSENQAAFQKTGGTHASAAFSLDGGLLALYEDIGRHNAVDKVIGGLLRKNILERAKVMLVSGRVSYEIVNKTRSAGIPYLAAVSAPSTMAVNNADDAGITLMAFCRKNKLTIYSHPERVLMNEPARVNDK